MEINLQQSRFLLPSASPRLCASSFLETEKLQTGADTIGHIHRFASAALNAIYTITLIITLTAPVSHAQDWSITTSDFRTRPADFRSLASGGVRAQIPGQAEPTTIPLEQFVSIQRSALASAAHPKFTLLLNNDDRLTGEPSKKNGEQLLWRSPALGEIPIPLNHLIALVRGNDIPVAITSPTQDVITLANGDNVAGVVTDLSSDAITIQTDTGPTVIAGTTITKVAFAAPAVSHPSNERAFRIKLTDGSTLTAKDAAVTDNQLTFAFDAKPPKTIQLPLAQLQVIEQLNGPLSWLSSRTPAQSQQISYLPGSTVWPARLDTAVDGSPIQFGAQRFEHGIGVHAYSSLTYTLDPTWSVFQTRYAIDSPPEIPRPLADITVRIKLDGKTAHEQTHVRAGILSPVVTINLNGAKTLTLEADYGDGGDTQDHLNWIEPALLRAAP